MLRMDKKLYGQLKGYADRNDDGMVSRSARRAIRKFINEQNDQKTKTIQEVSD